MNNVEFSLKFSHYLQCSSVQFSHSDMSKSLQTHGLHGFAERMQHARLPCWSPAPRACSNSCPSIQSCHPIISSFVVPFSSCLQSSPASWFFSNKSVLHNRWLEYQSFSFSISPSNEYSRLISFRMAWFDIFAVQWTLKNLLQQHSSKASVLRFQLSLWPA